MLQILSTSNETSTGAELVQNGNFSEIGSDLVTNGDFSDVPLGSELVTDGDFPPTSTAWSLFNSTLESGGVRIVNPDAVTNAYITQGILGSPSGKSFVLTYDVISTNGTLLTLEQLSEIALDTTTTGIDKKLYFTWDKINDTLAIKRKPGNIVDITIDNVSLKEVINLVSNPNFTETGADAILNGNFSSGLLSPWTASASGTGVVPVVVADGLNYGVKIVQTGASGTSYINQSTTLDIGTSYKFTYRIVSNDGGALQIAYPATTLDSTVGTRSAYFVATSTSFLVERMPGITDVVITDMTVKELGADWGELVNTEPIFNASGLTLSTSNGYEQRPYQANVITDGKSYKVTYALSAASYTTGSTLDYYDGDSYVNLPEQGVGTHTFYYTASNPANDRWYFNLRKGSGTDEVTISSISIQELGEGWNHNSIWQFGNNRAIAVSANYTSGTSLNQSSILEVGKYYKVSFEVLEITSGAFEIRTGAGGTYSPAVNSIGTYTYYLQATDPYGTVLYMNCISTTNGAVSNITVQELDPNGYWTIGTGWSIGDTKAISTVTGSSSYLTQAGIVEAGKTYAVGFEVVEYADGNVKATVSGSEGEARTSIGIYTDTLLATGSSLSIKSQSGSFDGSITAVSGKLLGTYSDQSIYVTAADVQTIAQASVYYLVELTSMASRNSLYFLPSSVVPNNGRYTKLNFTVISKDALPTPASGIISFYDSVGGFDTYPMGFYEFRIYEQTSSTNLDPLLATGLLEKGFAFVRDFSGNMQELTDGFKEYNPTLTQYVYSK